MNLSLLLMFLPPRAYCSKEEDRRRGRLEEQLRELLLECFYRSDHVTVTWEAAQAKLAKRAPPGERAAVIALLPLFPPFAAGGCLPQLAAAALSSLCCSLLWQRLQTLRATAITLLDSPSSEAIVCSR